jgi:hypothetical protein
MIFTYKAFEVHSDGHKELIGIFGYKITAKGFCDSTKKQHEYLTSYPLTGDTCYCEVVDENGTQLHKTENYAERAFDYTLPF